MRAGPTVLLLGGWLLFSPRGAFPQNAELEVSQRTLNGLLQRLGTLSETGAYHRLPEIYLPSTGAFLDCSLWGSLECPGLSYRDLGFERARVPLALCRTDAPGGPRARLVPLLSSVRWQWWAVDPYFTVETGSLRFTATLRSRVGADPIQTETRTVPASIRFDPGTNRLRFEIGAFVVRLQRPGVDGLETVKEVDVARLYGVAVPIPPQSLTIPKPAGGSKTVVARVASLTAEFLPARVRARIDLQFGVE